MSERHSTGYPAFRRGDAVANRASIRRTNLGLILRHLRANGARSRTQLADELGLPNSTVSSLINELVERRLVAEGGPERDGNVGRPRQAVELDGAAICGLGLEISVDYARAVALNLRGDVLLDRHLTIAPRQDSDALLDTAAGLISDALDTLRTTGNGVTGITIAAPGRIDRAAGVVLFAANMGWSNLPVLAGLAARLGPGIPPLGLGNDAKLGAVAEYALVAPTGIHDLIYLTGEVGVGAGIISDGQPLRGTSGFAGEVGHMPLDPAQHICACGRRGCWETMIGLNALMRYTDADDPVADPVRDLEDRLAEIRARADAGDTRTLMALNRIAHGLGLGISLLADVLNPQAVIMGGYFALLGEYLLDTTQKVFEDRADASHAKRCQLMISTLGFTSAARGGAQTALEVVFDDPGSIWASAPQSR